MPASSQPRERGRRDGSAGQRTTFDCLNALVDRRWLRRLTATELAVFVAYLRHADATGLAYPGNDLLADLLGHRDTGHVRKARSRLVALGLLERVTTGGRYGDDASRFRVKVPPWANSAHPEEGGPNAPTRVGEIGPAPCAHSAQKGGRDARTEGAQGRSTGKEHSHSLAVPLFDAAQPEPVPELAAKPEAGPEPEQASASAVDEIYRAYPRHVGPAPARRAIRKAATRLARGGELDPFGFLLERTRLYAAAREAACAADRGAHHFTPYPASWFNAERYLEDPNEWNERRGGSSRYNRRPAHESSFAIRPGGAGIDLLPRHRS